jgi:L-ascorbate metabolism protein UlaG (beta-lactamase superfamily)
MDITYLGAGSIKLSGKNLNLVVDPYDASAGLGAFTTKSDVLVLTGVQEYIKPVGTLVVDGPGEYEVKGAMITGVPARLHVDEDGSRGSVYSVVIDGVNVVITGNISGKLESSKVETLGKVDVLVVPVGGFGLTLDAEGAAAVVAQLEPSYVVPVHYDDGKTTYPMPQAGVELFLKEMGVSPELEPKLKVNAKEMPTETQVVLLARSGS